MKKGYILALLTVTFACLYASNAIAVAPVITNPGDVIIGNNEFDDSGTSGEYVFPTTINLDDIVEDNATLDADIKWSYSTDNPGTIEVNGAQELDPVGMVLDDNDPTSPRTSARIDRSNDPADGPNVGGATYNDAGQSDDDSVTLTFRNVEGLEGDDDASAAGDIGTSPVAVTLYASDCDTFTMRTILVYTRNKTSDSLTGDLGGMIEDFVDFPNEGTSGWTDRNLFGFAGTTTFVPAVKGAAVATLTGLCMTVGTTGDNATQWNSPDEWFSLTANTVYQVRYVVATDQGATDAQPLWFSIVANAHFGTHPVYPFFISWGSQRHRLDNTGGANGILDSGAVRSIGNNQYDHWVYPNPGSTDQWNGAVAGVGGAFEPAFAGAADPRVMFRIIDGGPAGPALNTDLDAGTICLNSVLVTAFPVESLLDLEVPDSGMNLPLDGQSHDIGFGILGANATADINSTVANAFYLQVTAEDGGTNTNTGGRSLRFDADADGSPEANNNLRRYPLVWNGDELLVQRALIRSDVTGGGEAGGEGNSPIDFVNLTWGVPTNEIGGFDFSGRGAIAGAHDRAASPALIANTGGVAQPYLSFFATHNASVEATIADAVRVRATLQLFGRSDIGIGVAGDPLVVEAWEINRINLGSGFDYPQ